MKAFKVLSYKLHPNCQNLTQSLQVSQNLMNQTAIRLTACLYSIYDSIQKWIAKEIIDFDPFEDEAITTELN
jgi:hypothetical protein